MPTSRGEILIDAPIDAVFDALLEGHANELSDNGRHYSMHVPRGQGNASGGRVDIRRPGLIEFQADAKEASVACRYELKSHGDGTLLKQQFDFRLHGKYRLLTMLFGKLIQPEFEGISKENLADIKLAIESGQSVESVTAEHEAERAGLRDAELQARKAAEEAAAAARKEALWQRDQTVRLRVASGYITIGKILVLACPVPFAAGYPDIATFLPFGGVLMYLGGRAIRWGANRNERRHRASAVESPVR